MVSPKPHVGGTRPDVSEAGPVRYTEAGPVTYTKDTDGVVRYDPAPTEGWWQTQDEAENHIRRIIEDDVARRTELMDQVRRGARTVKRTIRRQYPDETLLQLDHPIRLLLQNTYSLADLAEVLADVISPEQPS